MNNNKINFWLAGALLWSGAAHAEIYLCKDASGRTLTADRPIPECSNRTLQVLGRNGLVKREIAAPLTPEQKRQQQVEQEKRNAALAAAEEQKRQDRALLARYRSQDDIELARRRTLGQLQESLKLDRALLAEAQKRLQTARAEGDLYKKPAVMPAVLQRRIDDNLQSVADSKKQISERQAEIAQHNAKFDQTLQRYRELTGADQLSANTPRQ